jgi:hypothetical protein
MLRLSALSIACLFSSDSEFVVRRCGYICGPYPTLLAHQPFRYYGSVYCAYTPAQSSCNKRTEEYMVIHANVVRSETCYIRAYLHLYWQVPRNPDFAVLSK